MVGILAGNIWYAFSIWLGHALAALLEATEDEAGLDEDAGADEDAGTELGVDDTGVEETLEREELSGVLLGAELAGEAPQSTPLTVGRSAAPLFLVPWKPNETDWPGAIFPFHDMLVAV